ncbi:MAG: hypothetical protein ACD_76C00068G0004 [uncultured bacterium]|nr:MAG: hypothetical protein ACD_76C00068G0004 [uncultured bacterium]HBD05099.1 hypothetical protein [Candidatus Uhrbacteria bacterium]
MVKYFKATRAMAKKNKRQVTKKNSQLNSLILRRATDAVPKVPIDFTVSQTQQYLFKNIKKIQTVSYIYVVDSGKRLAGVFSIKELYRHSGTKKISDFCCIDPIVTVSPTDSEERAAYLALQHNIKAVPVIDKNKIFVGVIPNDQILKILQRDMREDLLHMAGIRRAHAEIDDVIKIPLFQAVKHRIPWLILGLIGGLVAAGIVGLFEETLERNLILASFIPLVVYIADSVRTQLEAFAIRDITLYRKLEIGKYVTKQMAIVLITALILSISILIFGQILNYELIISVVLGLAIFSAISSSVITGIGVPFLFRKMHIDPANASGPIGTILQDITSVSVYFLIATAILT